MLLAEYGSDSGSDDEAGPSSRPVVALPVRAPAPRPAAASTASVPPTAATAIKGKKRGGLVRITLDLPKASSRENGDDDDDESRSEAEVEGDEPGDGEREAKKPKLGGGRLKGGKGSSALLGMLPPPKRKLPTANGTTSLAVNRSMAAKPVALLRNEADYGAGGDAALDREHNRAGSEIGMLPPALARGRGKKEKQEASLDLFGLSAAPSSSTSTAPTPSKPPALEITSAPAVADFVPPDPTSSDPYPGYYQLPSGAWAAYEPEYYASFFAEPTDSSARPKDQRGADGRLGHHWDEFEGREGDVVDVHAGAGLEEARREEERRVKMIKPKMPGEEFEYKAIGQVKGLASERHQLTSLLNTAYTQREALEEKLTQNKKSMRVARTKYGF